MTATSLALKSQEKCPRCEKIMRDEDDATIEREFELGMKSLVESVEGFKRMKEMESGFLKVERVGRGGGSEDEEEGWEDGQEEGEGEGSDVESGKDEEGQGSGSGGGYESDEGGEEPVTKDEEAEVVKDSEWVLVEVVPPSIGKKAKFLDRET
jgi:hypothetical protein